MVNLTKGQKICLTKKSEGLKHINIAIGWAEVKQKTGLFSWLSESQHDIDCDVSLVLLNEANRPVGTSSMSLCYFGNKNLHGVHHSGDDLHGGGNSDNETITISLKEIDSKTKNIPVFMNIYRGSERHQQLNMLRDAYIRVYNPDNNEELCRYSFGNDIGDDVHGFIAGQVYQEGDEWRFEAIGEPVSKADFITDITRRWGIAD